VFPLAVYELCDGSYSVPLPCDLLPAGQYFLSVSLDLVLNRDTLKPELWYCDAHAYNFTAWYQLAYSELEKLHGCRNGAHVGLKAERTQRVVRIGPVGARAAASLPAGGKCERSFAQLAPSGWGLRWFEPAPALVPCTQPAGPARIMLFETGGGADSFHHCVSMQHTPGGGGGGGGTRPACVLGYEATPKCLSGVRTAFVGDSVVEGAYFDILHMWHHSQRTNDGQPVSNKVLEYCRPISRAQKWQPRGLAEQPPNVSVSTCGQNEGACGQKRALLNYLDLRMPNRRGLWIFLKETARLVSVLQRHDIVVLESSRHDLAQVSAGQKYSAGDKKRVLGQYRANAGVVARRVRQALDTFALSTRVVWRTAINPPVFKACPLVSNMKPIVDIANAAASAEFARYGHVVLPIDCWAAALHVPRWWPLAVFSDGRYETMVMPDVRTHEGWCPRAKTNRSDVVPIEQPGHRYGWVSKVVTLITMRALCALGPSKRHPPVGTGSLSGLVGRMV